MSPRARPLGAALRAAAVLLGCCAGSQAATAFGAAQAEAAPVATRSTAPSPPAGASTTASAATSDEFVYRTRAGDTLIGIAARLLKEPARWPAVQSLNAIRDPRRMPRDTPLRIPRDWLRTTPESATAVTVVGRATLDGRALAPGERAPAGATVETAADGAVTLELADGSTVTLQKSGTLELERLDRVADLPVRDVQLHLRRGRVDTRAKPQTDGSRFRIRTAVAVSAVRGTEFRTAVVPARDAANTGDGAGAGRAVDAGAVAGESSARVADSATTETLEGGVAVTSSDAAAGSGGPSTTAPEGQRTPDAARAASGVVVAGGFGTRVDEGAPPLPPRALLPPPDLAGVPTTNARAALDLEFPAVTGARRYRVQLATDADFRGIVGDVEVADPRASFAALPDGEYWLRARAIDEFAIEGVDAVRRVAQQRRSPPAPPALALAGRTGTRARLEWSATHAAAFDVQVARDPAFAQIVAERHVATAAFEWRAPGSGRYYVRARSVDADGVAGEFGPATAVDSPWPWWAKTLLPLLLLGAGL